MSQNNDPRYGNYPQYQQPPAGGPSGPGPAGHPRDQRQQPPYQQPQPYPQGGPAYQPNQGYPQAPIDFSQFNQPPRQGQQYPQGYNDYDQGYDQPQQEIDDFDPDSFSLPSVANSASDFKEWPQKADGVVVHLQVINIKRPVVKRFPKRDANNNIIVNPQTGQAEEDISTQVPITFEVFDYQGPFDLNGHQVNVWYNPSMNDASFMHKLVKAIKHNELDPNEEAKLSFLKNARVDGMVRLGKPKVRNGQTRQYPDIKGEFVPYYGPLVAGSPQEAFLTSMGIVESQAEIDGKDGIQGLPGDDGVPF